MRHLNVNCILQKLHGLFGKWLGELSLKDKVTSSLVGEMTVSYLYKTYSNRDGTNAQYCFKCLSV